MMKQIPKFCVVIWFGLFALEAIPSEVHAQEECTVGVAVAPAPKDGRPLLWKNRDTSHSKNAIWRFQRKRFPFLGIINAEDTTQVWMGVNAAGFAIMNAEAKDVEGTRYDDEGFLMKRALERCTTVADFESLLVKTNLQGRAVTSNFGVIDAGGKGAFFETGNHTFTRFNATNSELAPKAFLVRANFAFTGTKHGYGFERYGRAFQLFIEAVQMKELGPLFVCQKIARDIFPETLNWGKPDSTDSLAMADTRRTINRYRTASVALFQGVKEGEDPRLTTFWVLLGEPVCSVCVPLWVASGSVPAVLRGPSQPEINRLAQTIHKWAHPDAKVPYLLNRRCLRNARGTGILQKIEPVERKIFSRTQEALARWRRIGPNPVEMTDLQNWAAEQAVQVLREVVSELEDEKNPGSLR